MSRQELEEKLSVELVEPPVVVAYHPVTLLENTTAEFEHLLGALKGISQQLIFVYPNADAGSRLLVARSREFAEVRGNASVFVNLDHQTFLSLLALSSAMVGNSSSGIMESTSLNLPTVNIGIRQQGREHAGNVLDTSADTDDIARTMQIALSPEFRERVRGVPNPYGDGCASERILQVLRDAVLGFSLLMKAPLVVS